ncbi:MAG: NAD(+)/NADH kinase [Proteobacteria bacterium]|nr:NAD(+)/NADH kinase [Pseudomonadota bacterium]
MDIKKIGIIANIEKEKAVESVLQLKEWLLNRKLEVLLEEGIAGRLGESTGFKSEELASSSDIIVVFGGDGTLLRAARSIRESDVPILGINLGAFGFMAEVNLHEMFGAMELILEGDYQTEKRMMLDVVINRGQECVGDGTVLNDIVINRGNLSRMIELKTVVDGRYLTTVKADGLIISTPTGSTAYSLSAGGPIVFPELNTVIITPICPHTLTNRPVILPEDVTVKIVLWTKEKGATLTLDGQVSFTLKSGDAITIKKSRYFTSIIVSPDRDYLEILRTKLGWGGLPSGGN